MLSSSLVRAVVLGVSLVCLWGFVPIQAQTNTFSQQPISSQLESVQQQPHIETLEERQLAKMRMLLSALSRKTSGSSPPETNAGVDPLSIFQQTSQHQPQHQSMEQHQELSSGITSTSTPFDSMVPVLQQIATQSELSQLKQLIASFKRALVQVKQYETKYGSHDQPRAYGDLGHGSKPGGGSGAIMKILKTLLKRMVRMIQRLVQKIVQRFQQMVKGMRPRGLDMTDVPRKIPMPLPRPPPMPDMGPRDKPFPWYFNPPKWYNRMPEWWTDPKGAKADLKTQSANGNINNEEALVALLEVSSRVEQGGRQHAPRPGVCAVEAKQLREIASLQRQRMEALQRQMESLVSDVQALVNQ